MADPADTPAPAEDGEPDPTDPWARQAQTFPRLSEEIIARASRYGVTEQLAPFTEVFSRGDRGRDFFVLLEGTIEVYERDDDGGVRPLRSHLAREFTGELDLFNDRAILVSGRAGPEPARVVRIRRADFRRLVQSEPDIAEIVMRAFILRRVGLLRHGQGAAVLIGPAHSADTLRLQQFLNRNAYPLRLFDTEQDADAGGFLECFSLTAAELPVIVLPGHRALRNPSLAALADALGITEDFDREAVFDLAVVGAGPAGLAAAVYGASEGLTTIVVEASRPAARPAPARRSRTISAFPPGSAARRWPVGRRCRRRSSAPGSRSRGGRRPDCDDQPYRFALDDEPDLRPRRRHRHRRSLPQARRAGLRAIRRPGRLLRRHAMEANLCRSSEVIVVGGGNSAGQAAMFLSRTAHHVHVLVRGAGLAATMSDYLVQRIERSAQISLHSHCEIVGLEGESALAAVTWRHRQSGAETRRPVSAIFVMIGAEPNTGWVDGCLELDAQGFVVTGARAGQGADSPYATSRPGIYAVGDVRSGSVKRVASGVGEGSVVVQAVHRFLHPPEDQG